MGKERRPFLLGLVATFIVLLIVLIVLLTVRRQDVLKTNNLSSTQKILISSATPVILPSTSAIAPTPLAVISPTPNTTADYYAKKSEEEYRAGNKNAAIKTVQEGLRQYPNDELLKSKLDILEKDSFGNFDSSGGRQ